MGVSMGFFAANRPRLLSAIILAGFTFVLAWWLDRAPAPWDGLVRWSYDTLHITAPQPRLKDCPVAIVYLDLSSYDALKIDPGRPWPRRLHAQLLNQLTEAGARAVVFDIVFSEAGPDPAGDDAFTEAMRANGRVVLAAEYNNKATHGSGEGQQWVRVSKLDPPFEKFAVEARAI